MGAVLHPTAPRQVLELVQSSAGDRAARLGAVLAAWAVGNVPRKILPQKRQRALLPLSSLKKKQEKDTFL